MLRIIAFIVLVSFFQQCISPEPEVPKVNLSDPPAFPKRRDIIVSVDNKQQLYIGTEKIDTSLLDSLLPVEIKKFTVNTDTPTVVINADTAAWYGTVYHIMRIAKKNGAKVVATVR